MKELNTEYIGLRVKKTTMDKILTCVAEDKRTIADWVRLRIEEAVEKREIEKREEQDELNHDRIEAGE